MSQPDSHSKRFCSASQPWFGKNRFIVMLLVVSVFLGLCRLGLWQLSRAQEKNALAVTVQQSESQAPLTSLSRVQPQGWRTVVLKGRYDSKHQLLWQNRFHQHQVGSEVLTPFYLAGNKEMVLVNRGWVAIRKSSKGDVAPLEVTSGLRTIKGRVVVPKPGLLLGHNISDGSWPKTMQAWRWSDIQSIYPETKVFPVVIRLAKTSKDGFVREWPLWTLSPSRHKAYALQWFLFAGVWLIGWYYLLKAGSDQLDDELED